VLGVGLLAAIVVAIGVAGRLSVRSSSPASVAPAPSATATDVAAADTILPRPTPPRSVPAATAPSHVTCHGIDPWSCREAVLVGLALFDGDAPPASRVIADRSLLCSNDTDCPPGFLKSAEPVGSLMLTFVDGTRAWVNVLRTETTTRFEDHAQQLLAHVVRWFPAGS
jgi:hypothetical protein